MPDDTNKPAETPATLDAAKVAEIVNAAITSHSKRQEKAFEEKLAAILKAQQPQAPAQTEQTESTPTKSTKAAPEMSALQAKVEELLKANESERKAREAAEAKQRDAAAYAALKDSMKGVREDLRDAAADLLFHVQKKVTYDENGNILFNVRRAPAPGLAEEDVPMPIAAGVEHWMKSAAAAPFLPSPAAAANQGRGGRNPIGVPTGRSPNGIPTYDKPAATDDEKAARALEKANAMQAALSKSGF